ncbi:MAG: type II secretion system protein GspD [Cellvibrionales bacterium]|nr:type II secretion system protein GspD [Cellvibrionales bacterium]|tara:strand:- start:1840 stop:3756 length:1917 start_codon:yes stop_codon:yes gene_type:complete
MNFSLLLNAIFFSISVGFYSSATAQFPPQISNDQLAVNSEKKLKINMNNVDIKQVIQWMGEQTKKNFIVDPRVKGRVIVYSNQSMTLSEAYQVFLTMLDVHGFAAVQSGNNIKILPNAQARSAGIPIIEQFSDTKADNSELVIHIIKINNLSPEKIVSTLRPLVPQAGHLAALPESSSIIIADRANNINRLSELIRHLDVSGDLTIKVIAIKHASAEDIVKLLQSLIKETKTGIIQVAVDIRSNSILLAGAGDRQEAVENLIAQLDRPLQGNGNTKVIFLNYINAEDIEPLLSSVAQSIQGSQEITPDNSEVKIQASTTTNALVITAPPSIITSLEKVITKLDVKRSQVLIEAIIVEVSEAFTKELEVFWTNNADSQSLVSGNFLSSTSNTPANVQNNPSTLLNQDGLNLGFFKDADIRGLLKMIKTDSRNNVLSTPSIITIDNEEAQMLVGKTVPFVTGSRLTGSTNNVNSSYAIPYRTIQREDVGITLKITPKISKAGTITLEIDQEVESVTETQISSEGISTNKRSIKTNVLIENGRILVLGGLIEESKTVNKTKIPILGDIPLLGALFRGTSETISKQNLMVFIKPTIIDDLEVADQRTREKYKLIQKQQIEGIDNKEIAILPKIETLESPAVK